MSCRCTGYVQKAAQYISVPFLAVGSGRVEYASIEGSGTTSSGALLLSHAAVTAGGS
jgi:hypothetical protein